MTIDYDVHFSMSITDWFHSGSIFQQKAGLFSAIIVEKLSTSVLKSFVENYVAWNIMQSCVTSYVLEHSIWWFLKDLEV